MGDYGDGSGDQYIIDRHSIYPAFSDVQTDDYSIGAYSRRINMPPSNREYAQRPAGPAMQIPQQLNDLRTQIRQLPEQLKGIVKRARGEKFSAAVSKPHTGTEIDTTCLIIMIVFIILIAICYFHFTTVTQLRDLREQFKDLKQLLKKLAKAKN